MPGIEPPSFSLGLDFDDELEPKKSTRSQQQQHSSHNSVPPPDPSFHILSDEQDFGFQVMDSEDEGRKRELGAQVMDSDPESKSGPPRVLKRLRRGTRENEEPRAKKREVERVCNRNGDEEIEEFSSQEDFFTGAHPSTRHSSICSSSKISLHGLGVLTTQSSRKLKQVKQEQASDAPACSSLKTVHKGLLFPKLTISPLRRFQLMDSDSEPEEPSISEDASKTKNVDAYSKRQHSTASEQKGKMHGDKHQTEDLWHDFCPIKNFQVPTPVLDEVCEEYFQSLKNKNVARQPGIDLYTRDKTSCPKDANNITGFEQCWNFAQPRPPAHHYFFHDDLRIRKLVCSRIPNFSPLGIVNNKGNPYPSESVIDYLSQFKGEGSKQKGTRRNISVSSARGLVKPKKSNAKDASPASQGSAIPKDAGKRRVHANGQASGHWYTSPEGRKVYVSRSGQELSGQIAYRHYRKENGGSGKSKKKTNAKRKKG